MRAILLMVLVAAGLTSGCATATRGTTEQVTFVSDPAGAKMETTTGLVCITPCTLEVPRKDTFTAKFTLDGAVEEVFVDTEVPDQVAATTAANILLTPIIAIPVAIAVDAASGANLNHTPNPVVVTFPGTPEDGADPEAVALKPREPSAEITTQTKANAPVEAVRPTAPEAVFVRVGLDFTNGVFTDCIGFGGAPSNAFALNDLDSWRPLVIEEDPGLNMKARIRMTAGAPVLEIWPFSDEAAEDRVIRIPMKSLEPGQTARVFTGERMDISPYQQCGNFAMYAEIVESDAAARAGS